MKYYVSADIHGFYDEFISSLEEAGYFKDEDEHKLILLGDLFDRGRGACKLEAFIKELIEKDGVILIKGNHEDLFLDMVDEWNEGSYFKDYNRTNGTLQTALDLTNTAYTTLYRDPERVEKKINNTYYKRDIIPRMLDYYESSNYIFVHGWIPYTQIKLGEYQNEYVYNPSWRNAGKSQWEKARWINGMESAHSGLIENGKTIVCGHCHTSFAHSRYEGRGGEFTDNPDFSPYYGKGIIALDGCTAFSGRVNTIIIED